MNIVTWMLAGAVLGWIVFSFLGWNETLGMMVSIVIGAMGAILGGKLLAPMFTTTVLGDFSVAVLMVAIVTAAALLAVGNLLQHRFGAR